MKFFRFYLTNTSFQGRQAIAIQMKSCSVKLSLAYLRRIYEDKRLRMDRQQMQTQNVSHEMREPLGCIMQTSLNLKNELS